MDTGNERNTTTDRIHGGGGDILRLACGVASITRELQVTGRVVELLLKDFTELRMQTVRKPLEVSGK